MYIFLSVALVIESIMLVGTMALINSGKTSDIQKVLNFLGVSVTLLLLGGFFSFSAVSMETLLPAYQIESIGAVFFVVLLSLLSMLCCNIRIPKGIYNGLLLYGMLSAFMILISVLLPGWYLKMTTLTDNAGELMTEGMGRMLPGAVYPFFHGVLKYIEISCSLVISLVTFGLLFRHYHVRQRTTNPGAGWLLAANLLPAAGNLLLLVDNKTGFYWMNVVFGVCWGYIIAVVYRFRLFDSMQMAKDDILETIEDGFAVVDFNGKLLYANEYAKKAFPELNYEATQDQIVEKLMGNDKNVMEIGENRFQISLVPFYDKQKYKGTTIWMTDKTEEYHARQKLIELKEEAEKANDAKSMFLANMSHEIRTPMNAIIGMTELILNDNINSNVEESANNIRNASNTLLSIINGILDFSKIETGNMEIQERDYSLGLLVKDAVYMANLKLADKNVEMIVHMKETIPAMLHGDEMHVHQIFTNIFSNAAKYTKRGYIRMNLDWEKHGKDAMISVSVEDTGCGIKEESIPTLFDSFQRADMIKNRTIEGTGLGLAICKRLVEAMGGAISVKSSYGVGSVFSFYFHQKIADETPVGNFDELELPAPGGAGKKSLIAPLAKILVVDDNITNIKVAQGILTMYQVRVDTALSGRECLEKIEKHNYHMIFMDHMMPDMDGIETTKLIRLHDNPEIRSMVIIALTANAISGTREMFLQNGFQEYISKPINLNSIEAVLKKYLPSDIIHYVEKDDDLDYSEVEIELPHVDVASGLNNYGGNKTRYLQILKFIYDDGAGHVQRIKDCLMVCNYRDYIFEVHALKGLMAGIGAMDLAEFARLQEYAARDGNFEVIRRESSFMVEQYETMLENIKNLLNDNGLLREEIIQIRDKELTWEEFCSMLHSLQGSLDLLEQAEAARKVDNLLTYPLDTGIRRQLIEIKHAIGEFEYDEAAELIRQLL